MYIYIIFRKFLENIPDSNYYQDYKADFLDKQMRSYSLLMLITTEIQILKYTTPSAYIYKYISSGYFSYYVSYLLTIIHSFFGYVFIKRHTKVSIRKHPMHMSLNNWSYYFAFPLHNHFKQVLVFPLRQLFPLWQEMEVEVFINK